MRRTFKRDAGIEFRGGYLAKPRPSDEYMARVSWEIERILCTLLGDLGLEETQPVKSRIDRALLGSFPDFRTAVSDCQSRMPSYPKTCCIQLDTVPKS